jgi:Transposase DDE domain
VLVPPEGAARDGKRPGWENRVYEQTRGKLQTDRGRALYALRKITIEAVFGQIKYNRRVDQFMRRGRAAVHSELRLVAATHNMLSSTTTGSPTPPEKGDSRSSRGDTFTPRAENGIPVLPHFRRPVANGTVGAPPRECLM